MQDPTLKDSAAKETDISADAAIANALVNNRVATGRRGGNRTFTAIAMMAAAKSDGARVRAESSLKKARNENRKLSSEVFLYRTERDELLKKVEALEKENERLYAAIAQLQNDQDDVSMGSTTP